MDKKIKKNKFESKDENINKVLHDAMINDLLVDFVLLLSKHIFLNKRLLPEMRFDL